MGFLYYFTTTHRLMMILSVGIVLIFLSYMNLKGIEYTEDNSTAMSSFMDATQWLTRKISSNDIVFVPHPSVFYSMNPNLNDQYRDYKVIWDLADVILQASTTENEVSKVKQYLEAVIRYQPRIKYLVIEWSYPYSNKIFTTQSCSDLGDLLHEVKRFSFITPNIKWKNKMIVCGVTGRT